jgi:hypothetical protein
MTTKPALALAVALALGCSGCVGSASTHSSVQMQEQTASGSGGDGRVVGTLEMVGGPTTGPRPQPHAVFRVLSGSTLVRRVVTDGRGRFSFLLPPGKYELTMGATTPIKPMTLRVVAEQITHLPLRIVAM